MRESPGPPHPKMASPTVSIITPSFNQARYIEATIRSVLEQDQPGIEYLVVDGGSTDGTLDVLRDFGDRVRWTSESDRGQGHAIDKGIRMTSGPIVAWLNADDAYLPGAVSTAVDALARSPDVSGIYGEAEFIDASGAVLGPCNQIEPFNLSRLINELDYIVQPATFFRRTAYKDAGGLDLGLRYCLDYDLWIRMGQRVPLAYVNQALAQVRLHPETKTASGGLPRLLEIEAMVRRHGRRSLPVFFQREMTEAAMTEFRRAAVRRRWGEAARELSRFGEYAMRRAERRLRRVVSQGDRAR